MPNSPAYADGWLFADTLGGRYGLMKVVGFAVFSAAPNAAQLQALRYSSYVRFDIRPQIRDQIVLIGDSRMAGTKSGHFKSVGSLLAELVGRRARVISMGNPGQTAAQMASLTVSTAAATFSTGAKNTAFVLAGVNDIIVNNSTPAAIVTTLQGICQTLKTAGYTVYLINELTTTTATNSANTVLPTLRALITSTGAATMNADGIIEATAYTGFLSPSNTVYYPDGLHFSEGLSRLLASVLLRYV